MGRSLVRVAWELYRTPSACGQLLAKAYTIMREHGVLSLVPAVRAKSAFPTKPIAALLGAVTSAAASPRFEERTTWPGQGLSLRHSVTVIILTRGNQDLLDRSLTSMARSIPADSQVSFIIVNNGRPLRLPRSQSFPFRLTLLRETSAFNWSAYNNRAATLSDGEFLLFLNDDVAALHTGWLDAMLLEAIPEGVGAVGAILLYPDSRIQHAGIAIATDGAPYHPLKLEPNGAHNRALPSVTIRAVTGACLLTSRKAYEQAGHFNPIFPLSYNDVDYCLRLARIGRSSVVSPHATLLHTETATRPLRVSSSERARFQDIWPALPNWNAGPRSG